MKVKFATLLVGFMALFFTGLSVQAQTNAYTSAGLAVPTVTSDKLDYAPGEIAHITGTGWTLDDSVHVEFKETPDYPDFHIYDLKVNADGTWQIDYQVEIRHFGVTFTVLAAGKQTSANATTVFTDGGLLICNNSVAANPNICANSLNIQIHSFYLDGNANPDPITSISFTTNGNYSASEILNFKLYQTSTNAFSTSNLLSTLLSATTTPPKTAGKQTFSISPGFSNGNKKTFTTIYSCIHN